MGWLKSILVGVVTAKTYQNVYNRPIVVAPDDYVVRGLKQNGLGSSWTVKYSKKSAMNITSTFTISGKVRSVSIGQDKFFIDWS